MKVVITRARFRRLRAACVLLGAGWWAVGSSAAESPVPAPAERSVLRIGTALDSYPYSFVDADGKLQGFAVDLLRAMEAATGLAIELKPVPNARWAEGFARDEYDVHGLLVRTPERQQQLDFSAAYLRLQGAVFIRSGTPPVNGVADLAHRRIVVHQTSAGREFLTRHRLAYETADARNVEDTLKFVSSGRYDVTLAARLTALSILRREGIKNVVPSGPPLADYELSYAFAVRKGDQRRVDLLNEGLAVLNRSGEFERIYDRWFGAVEGRRYTREQIVDAVTVVLGVFLSLALLAWWRQRVLRQRLARESQALADVIRRAGCVLWSAKVVERDDGLAWEFSEIRGAFEALGLAGADVRAGILFTAENTPDYAEIGQRAAAAIRVRANGYEQELRVRNGGTIHWLAERVSLTAEGAGRWHAVGAIVDVTRLKDAETEIRRLNETLEQRVRDRTTELEAALREQERFAYSVSHDLRSPLRNVAGFAQLALRRLPPGNPPEIHRHLTIVESEAMRLSSLIDELLEFSRLGRREFHRERVDLNQLADDVRGTDLRTELLARRIDWRVRPLPAVAGDPTLLRQVLCNLLGNAVKFTGKRNDATITLEPCAAPAGQVGFLVRDNGAGFDPRYAHKLFGVFQRLHSAREFAGTGIGLATVHLIVQRHGGTIRAEGRPGEGATFFVTLPAA